MGNWKAVFGRCWPWASSAQLINSNDKYLLCVQQSRPCSHWWRCSDVVMESGFEKLMIFKCSSQPKTLQTQWQALFWPKNHSWQGWGGGRAYEVWVSDFPSFLSVAGGREAGLGPGPVFVILPAGSHIFWVGLHLLLHICPPTPTTSELSRRRRPGGGQQGRRAGGRPQA